VKALSTMLKLPSILRPRWTLKYTVSSIAAAYVAYCLLLGMPLLSSNLPSYTGPYPVGTIDLEAPCQPRVISDVTIKSTGDPAFKVRYEGFPTTQTWPAANMC